MRTSTRIAWPGAGGAAAGDGGAACEEADMRRGVVASPSAPLIRARFEGVRAGIVA